MEYYLALLLFSLLLRPLTVIIHEMGHALAFLILTKNKLTIYIGSYGDPEKSVQLKWGRLKIYFRYKAVNWELGLCVPEAKPISIYANLLGTLAGPFASLATGIIALTWAWGGEWNGMFKFMACMLAASTAFDFYINLWPMRSPISLHDGTLTYNDGEIIRQLWTFRGAMPKFRKLHQMYMDKAYKAAAAEADALYIAHPQLDIFLRCALSAHVADHNLITAQQRWEELVKKYSPYPEDYTAKGLLEVFSGKVAKSLSWFEKALELDAQHFFALQNLGYAEAVLGNYERALKNLELALQQEGPHEYPLTAKGLVLILMGELEKGLAVTEKAQKLNPQHSYIYQNFGKYYYAKGDFARAKIEFERAHKLNPLTVGLSEDMARTKTALEQ